MVFEDITEIMKLIKDQRFFCRKADRVYANYFQIKLGGEGSSYATDQISRE